MKFDVDEKSGTQNVLRTMQIIYTHILQWFLKYTRASSCSSVCYDVLQTMRWLVTFRVETIKY